MPSYVQIHSSVQLASAAIWGKVSLSTLTDLLLTYAQSADANNAHNFLVDLTGVTDVDLTFADMQYFVDIQNKQLSGRSSSARSALYAPSDLSYGFARMYVSISAEVSPRPVGAFRKKTELFGFLGLAPDSSLLVVPPRQE